MGAEHFIAFNLALLAAVASPGPALLVALRTTLSAGRRAGIAAGGGLALMAAAWTLVALLGLDAIFALFPWAYVILKTLGALYLIYISWKMWTGARDGIGATAKPARHAFRQGLLINVLNPKSVIFAGAVLVVIFPPGLSLTESLMIAANHLALELAFYTTLALAMSTEAVSRAYLRAKFILDRAASVILGALGLRLLFSR